MMPRRCGAGLMNDRFSADDLPRRAASAARPIDLAHTRPFRIADVDVRPATREVIRGDRCEGLEPLVMQVLVALTGAKGEILSRDDLIDACWSGRAVTDDAINRVISRLRAVGRAFGGFTVETITKVGYRLVEEGHEASLPIAPRSSERTDVSRRTMIAGGLAFAGAGAGFLLLRQPWKHQPPAKALDLFQRAEITLRQGLGNLRQAISYYGEAVRVDPLYAKAWGALALAYTHQLEGYSEAEMRSVPGKLRSAARRALDLEPDNADAQLALILVRPMFKNWASMETQLRRFNQRHRNHWLGMGRLASLLFDVGRTEEGISIDKQVFDFDPMLPVGEAYLVNAMLNTDRLQEAEERLDRAEHRWPGHPSLWAVHYKLLMFNGRPQAASSFVMNPDLRPSDMTAEDVAIFARLARAVDTRRPHDVAASIEDFRNRAVQDVRNTPMSAEAFALLGRTDLTFASLETYFFNSGKFGKPVPIEPFTRRYARELFSRPLAPMRDDPRFKSILQRIGLEDYWRRSGTIPDYRRSA
jgi:DNA-binding winged helix-turn-helix (wHTH) protein/tetratricopeptide (TPR) repeat protein